MENYAPLIITVIIIAIIACTIGTVYIRSIRNNILTKRVFNNSEQIKSLISLNNSTTFNNVNRFETISCTFDNKRKFDNTNINTFFINFITSNFYKYKTIAEKISENKKLFNIYLDSYNKLQSNATEKQAKESKVRYKTFLKLEIKLYKKYQMTPVMDIFITCKLSYTSPQGRNHYSEKEHYSFLDVRKIITPIVNNQQQEV